MQQKLIEFDELGEFGGLGVAKVVDPVIDASSTPDICDAFSERGTGRGHPIPNVKPEWIKTVLIFCDKAQFGPILEHLTGPQVQMGA